MDNAAKSSCHQACCESSASSVRQTLDEMDFERGIWGAALSNDLPRLRSLLAKGIGASMQDSAGYTALHYAARAGYFDVCQMLISHGANVNAVTRAGHATALHRATKNHHVKIVHLLLNHGADRTIVDADGKTALFYAQTDGKKCLELVAALEN